MRGLILIFFILVAPSQGAKWLSFGGEGWFPPQVECPEGDNITLTIPGVVVRGEAKAKEEYQLLRLPGEGLLSDPGKPQLPRIIRILAIPAGVDPKVEVVSEKSSVLEGYNIWPAPKPVIKRSADGIRWVDYEFTKDDSLYSQDEYYPPQCTCIEKSGWLRGQRIAWLSVCPIQFNPQRKAIRVYTSLKIKVAGVSDVSPADLGPLSKLGQGLLLNYPQEIGDMPPSRRGGISRPQNLRLVQNQADYLIISPDAVYGSQWLDSLACWRAENNGFQVAVVKLSDIYAQFPSFGQDQSIKDFLTYVYENWSAPGMGDGHLGYVLLGGDAAEGDPLYLPTHYRNNVATDHWYACLNDDEGDGDVDDWDDTPDILIGRFSIGSQADLQAEVEKTLSFERTSWDTVEWKRKILLYSGFITAQVDDYLGGVFAYIQNLTSKQDWFVISDTLYRSDYPNPEVWEVKNKFLAGLNQGRGIVDVQSHGAPDLWGDGHGWHIFYNYEVADLANAPYYPVVLSYSCETAWFDSLGFDCLGEAFVRAKDKGAVAFYGSSRWATGCGCQYQSMGTMEALLGYKVYNLGEMILWGKLKANCELFRFNLLGDPALSFDSRPRLGRPDLAISPEDISVIWFPWSNSSRTVLAKVHNLGRGKAEDVKITFWDGQPGGEKIGEGRAAEIEPLGEAEVSTLWQGNLSGSHQLWVQIDPQDSIPEIGENNNLAYLWIEAPQFVDVADQMGINYSSQDGVWGDYDGDGDLDLLLLTGSSWYPERPFVRLLENGICRFTDVTSSCGILPSYLIKGATWGDYDNDGDLDLYLVGDGRNYLYQNQGSGRFVDITAEAGVEDLGNGFGAAFLDLDNDGLLDILLENYSGVGVWYFQPRQLIYFHNNGDGSFANLTSSSGLENSGEGYGIAVGDYDNDGDLDFYFPNYEENLLLQNQGNGSFQDVTSQAGVGYTATSLVATFGDYDNDGDLDLYVGNYRENILYRNNGDGTFNQVSSGAEGIGTSRVVSFLDCDNDGWLDIFNGEGRLRLYRNQDGEGFEDLLYFAGNYTPNGVMGMSPADYDMDGWTDILVCRGNYLLRNLGEDSHWLKVRLEGLKSNTYGLGAWVKVASGDLIQSRVIYPSTTLFPHQPPLFGLGDKEVVDSLVVRWPSGRRSFLGGIGVDQTIEVQEPLLERDLALKSILCPGLRASIEDTIRPAIVVENIGKFSVDQYEVSCQIDAGGTVLYSHSIQGWNISSYDTAKFAFPSWVPPLCRSYDFGFSIHCPADQDTGNNQIVRRLNISAFHNITFFLPDSGRGASRYVCFGDYNQDGYPDILLVTSNSLKVYQNQRGKGFADVSKELALPLGDFCSAIFLDYNNDGYLDILALRNSGHPFLLRNEEGKDFVDVSESVGLSKLDSYQTVAIADYDQDGWPDLFLSYRDYSRSVLLRNMDGKFANYTGSSGISSAKGFTSVVFFDYDNDGDLDLFLTTLHGWPFLYENNNGGSFADVTSSVGLRYAHGEDIAVADYDNDGDLDLFLINKEGPNILYRNQGDSTFRDGVWEVGIDYPGGGEAFAFSDIDQDGYLDFYIVEEDGEDAFFRSDLSGSHWLEVKLSGTLSNSLGIGGRVELFSGEGRQVRWLMAAKGDYPLHFGLGDDKVVDSLRINWPSGKRQILTGVNVDQIVQLTEPILAHDLRVEAILSPPRELSLGEPIVPQIRIKNVGQSLEEGFQVSYTLDTEEKELFSETKEIFGLESLDTVTVTFSPWNPKDLARYTLRFEVVLPSDLDLSDNSATLETILPIFSPSPYSGLFGFTGSYSLTLGDYNSDGRPDLYLSSGRLFGNQGEGVFPDFTGIAGVGEKGRDVLFFDYDNDGDEDLLVVDVILPYILYRNGGDGFFTRNELEGGISGSNSFTVADYDNDGYLDLFVLTHNKQGILLRNLGDGSFEDRTEGAGLEGLSRPYAALFFDYDLDGDEDLFILSGYGYPNQLYRNNGEGTFEDVAGEAGVKEVDGWEVAVGDYDNDGLPDIFIPGDNIIIYHNEGEGKFKGYSNTLGFEGIEEMRSGTFGDYDNDGWLDLNLTSVYDKPNILFRNQGDGTFSQLGDLSGFGDRSGWFGSIFFDYDSDGDQDLYLMSSRAYNSGESALYQNNLKGNNWLDLKLVGKESNRDGIGALVRVVAGGLVQMRESSFGLRFHTLPWLHFGLGKRLKADTILVRWPSGIADTLVDVRANRTLVIEEGKATERYGLPKTFTLSQNYPNPFNSVTVIRYGIPYGEVAKVKLTIYDILGRKVRRFFEGEKRGGFHQLKWDGKNSQGEKVGSGIYFYRLEAKWQGMKTVMTRKMILLK